MRFFLHVVLNKCGLCHFRYFVQLITVTVSFESLFFVRSVFCVFVFVFVFSPVSLYFIFSCLGLLESLRSGHFLFSSSRFLIFDTFCAFSSLGFTFCNTIPFGWNLSAYVYHSTGLLVSHYFRSIGIPCSLYIDIVILRRFVYRVSQVLCSPLIQKKLTSSVPKLRPSWFVIR